MAFWGVVLRPGMAVTHCCEKGRGRLRISQATCGIGFGGARCGVQCSVGNRGPFLLCSLIPHKVESLQLDLEFQEEDDVVFSVVGSGTVHLAGYYIDPNPKAVPLDIQNHDLQRLDENNGKDGSNTNETLLYQNLPTMHYLDLSKTKNKIEERHQIEKPSEVPTDNDDHTSLILHKDHEAEAPADLEIGESYLVTASELEGTEEKFMEVGLFKQGSLQADGVTEHLLADNGGFDLHKSEETSPEKIGVEDQNVLGKDEAMQEAHVDNNTEDLPAANGENQKDLIDSDSITEPYGVDVENTQTYTCDTGEKIAQVTTEMEDETKNDGLYGNETKQICVELERVTEPPLDEKMAELDNGKDEVEKQVESLEENSAPIQEVVHGSKTNETFDGSMQSLDLSKSKKKRKERRHEMEKTIEVVPMTRSKAKKKRKERHEIKNTREVPADNEGPSALILKHEEIGVENQNVLGNDESMHEANADSIADLSAANGENLNIWIDSNEEQSRKTKRTLSNGLTIEELRSGPPGGKVAVPGKKVKVYYTAMFKESEHVFDTNVGSDGYRFLLGNEGVIDGWNAGIDGMRVGDKRRLIVPPSLGYGKHGSGQIIPPDSWLVYDIELLSVHRPASK